MMNDSIDNLDALLARTVPPSASGETIDTAIRGLAEEARTATAAPRRWRRRAALAGGAAAILGLTGAVATAALQTRQVEDEPFGRVNVEWQDSADTLEWVSRDLDGTRCIHRLTGFALHPDELSALREGLSDPSALLAADNGAVRAEFLSKGWADDEPGDLAIIDAAYAEVARLDMSADTSSLHDGPLTLPGGSADHELFDTVYLRLILDGLGAGPRASGASGALRSLVPESACEAAK